jgi:hypothetical protein
MSETVTGSELARLILRRGTTAAEAAAMDVESLTRLVADRRPKEVPRGAVSPSMTDEQIARAILEYAQSDPGDWPVAPRATTSKRACGPGLLGALGGGVGAVVFVVLGLLVVWDAGCIGEWAWMDAFEGVMLGTPLAAILGAALALVVTRVTTGTGRPKRAILPLATGLTVSFIIAAGFWWWQLADVGQVDRFINHYTSRSADSLLSGADLSGLDLSGLDLSVSSLTRANLSDADLSGADLSDANLREVDLSGADLSEADLSGAGLHEANLSKANLLGAKVTQAQLDQAASLEGTTMPDGTVHE